MNPGITFNLINELQPVSFILTSGTLSPMESYEAELKIPFDVKLSCSHVIDPAKQVFVRVVKKSMNKYPLNFSFKSRDNDKLIQDLGNCLINLIRVAPAGCLVFFTSYKMMEDCIKKWQSDVFEDNTTFLLKMNELKTVCTESKNKMTHEGQMRKYMSSYKKGAVFFAVCGGKISEGIDFADDMARLVIVVGIPYGYMGDCKNKSKMNYLDNACNKQQEDRFKLNGSRWYELKTMRTLSQSIGRVIRHKNDYGAIILLDERMEKQDKLNQLSSWVRQEVKVEDSLIKVIKPLKDFFKDRNPNQGLTRMEQEVIKENEELLNSTHDGPLRASGRENMQVFHKPLEFNQRPFQRVKPSGAKNSFGHFGGHTLSNLAGKTSQGSSAKGSMEKENEPIPVPEVRQSADISNSNSMTRLGLSAQGPMDIKMDLDELARNPESLKQPGVKEWISKLHKMAQSSQDDDPENKGKECKICFEVPESLYVSDCGHVACWACWTRIKKDAADKGSKTHYNCPHCKTKLSRRRDVKKLYL